MKIRRFLAAACVALTASIAQAQDAPAPVAPLPTADQVAWQQLETYAFIHFGPNTFGDREWGYGDAPLESFNPTRLDCEQWARVCKAAGMKGIILTAKHHDGFCLWPTKYTDYSVRNTPYKDGKGDIVGELAAACRKHGLKLGLYLSPWDRHQAFYGTPLYVEYFRAQLNELLTQYGEIFEVWFDGANGGDGWYGGAKETRKIDRSTYYNYPSLWKLVGELQPHAILFSDAGPGCRWVGNENGYADATNWSFLRTKEVYPGYERYPELQYGHESGDKWVPSECNTSIRPGWFYHEREDEKVKSVDHLVDLYYRSVGHNGTFLLNFPVDKEGLIHPNDSANAVDFHKQVMSELKSNLLTKASVKASDTRGKAFSTKNLIDGVYDSYWATPDGVSTATLNIKLGKAQKLNRLMLSEYIPLGQRVRKFSVEYLSGKQWLPIKVGEATTTIGYKRLLRFPTVTTRQLRIRFEDSRGPLCINEIGAYYAPNGKSNYSEQTATLKGFDYKLQPSAAGEGQGETLVLDLGQVRTLRSLHYKPSSTGMVSNYEILAGESLDNLHAVASGEFSNIRNNPIMQDVYFAPINARYVMFRATRMVRDGEPIKYDQLIVK
ncbi:MAG: alpha-L-fucosidase [Prevotella sp.]|nr:alpha-L-fucosidase [Prevotella sp.]